MLNIFKGWLAGFLIGLAGMVYLSYSGISLGFTALGAFLFSFGLYGVLEYESNLVTGKFAKLYNGEWSLRQILLIFGMNLVGTATVFLIRAMDANTNIVYELAAPIVAARDAKLWYQHIAAGIGCGACIQVAVNNYQKHPSFWGVCLPVMVFILCGFEHCIADSFYYYWSPFTWRHLLQIFEVFFGNAIGAQLIVAANSGILPQYRL